MSIKRHFIEEYFICNAKAIEGTMKIQHICNDLVKDCLSTVEGEMARTYTAEDINELVYAVKDNFIRELINGMDKLEHKTSYKHLGYYWNLPDIKELCQKDADAVVEYMSKGYGDFTNIKTLEEETDVVLKDETKNIENGFTKVTKDGKYIVTFDVAPMEKLKDLSDDTEGFYIDIYEKRY